MRKRVVVTGLGCVSPVGNTVEETWQALLAGKSGAANITHFDASQHKTKFAAEVKGFDGVALFGTRDARKMDRFTQFAMAATYEALNQSGLTIDTSNRDRIGVLIGSGIGGIITLLEQAEVMRERGPDRISPFLIPMMISDGAAGMVAIRLGVRGPNMALATACASGSNAIGEAAEIIRRGAADVMIAGASEASIVALAMGGMNVMGALSTRNEAPQKASRPFDKTRDGFLMGEGAGIVILETLEHAQERGAEILSALAGYGTSDDAYHVSAPAENGAGAALSMQYALDDAGLEPEDIGYINAHGTSTPLNDKSETAAIKTVFGEQAYSVPISSTKSMTGHLLGASGAVEAVVCTKVFQEKILPATINYETPDPECDLDYVPNQPRKAAPDNIMSNSFGFGGHNATLILKSIQVIEDFMTFAHITGWGMSVPETILTNEDLSKMVDTNDEWIRNRTGIRERRIVSDGQSTASLAVEASLKALQVANLHPGDIDLIICSTSTPEHIFPATACLVQDQIGASKAGAFDLLAACTGFIYGLNLAAQSIRSGSIQNALVIGSETLSRFVNWRDRNTCILFGDGAGAFVLQASDKPGGVLSAVMHSDGSGGDLLILPGGGSKHPATEATVQAGRHYIEMDGKEVYRFATRVMAQATREALGVAGLALEDVKWIIPHQANIRIIEAAARGLKMPMDRFIVNLERYGNTSTASIPIATVEAIEDSRVQPGDKIVFVGFGAGLTWGALAAEWTGPLPSERKVYPRSYRTLARVRSFLLRVARFIEGIIWGRGS